MKSLRLAALACCLAVVSIVAFWPTEAVAQAKSAGAMAQAANAFLKSLTPEQRAKAVINFEDEERFNWDEAPRPRKGVPLQDLSQAQRDLAMALLRTSVGETGYQKIQTIFSRESVLKARRLATGQGPSFDPELYFVSIFGTPSATNPWGWRFEGHHISANFTIRSNTISNAPLFLGAQPANLEAAGLKGPELEAAQKIPPAFAGRALAGEEDRARALVQSLDAKQRAIAIFDRTEKRTADMLSGINNRRTTPLNPPGLFAKQMTPAQKKLLVAVVEEYLNRMPADVGAERRRRLLEGSALDEIAFQWVGGTEAGQAHNYTVQGPTFLIEYAQSRGNNVGHIHTIWRDFNGDFGADIVGSR